MPRGYISVRRAVLVERDRSNVSEVKRNVDGDGDDGRVRVDGNPAACGRRTPRERGASRAARCSSLRLDFRRGARREPVVTYTMKRARERRFSRVPRQLCQSWQRGTRWFFNDFRPGPSASRLLGRFPL